ncbi:MAG: hypothetical protein ACI8U4_002593 [Natronomonas sp.]|jgi:hypothetical protein
MSFSVFYWSVGVPRAGDGTSGGRSAASAPGVPWQAAARLKGLKLRTRDTEL